jgi:AcrR family transcriptional regulator
MNLLAAPAGSRMERKKEETRHRIVGTAMELFKQQGVDATTMEQIAHQADIAKGTLYNYFPVKEAIISAYIQQSFREKYSQRILQLSNMLGVRGRMTFMLGILMEGVQEQKEIFEKYLVYQIQNMISVRRDAGVPSGLRELAREIIIRGQNDGEIRSDLPLDILVALFEFVFVEVAQEFYMKPDSFNLHKTIESCVDLFMNGAKRQR